MGLKVIAHNLDKVSPIALSPFPKKIFMQHKPLNNAANTRKMSLI